MLRQLDPNRDNLADNEEIQELYRACMALRPKIVKLIDKYSQKRGMWNTVNIDSFRIPLKLQCSGSRVDERDLRSRSHDL